MTIAEVGELINDTVEGQQDVTDANREQEEIAAELLDHETEDDISLVICHMAADENVLEQTEPDLDEYDDFDLAD